MSSQKQTAKQEIAENKQQLEYILVKPRAKIYPYAFVRQGHRMDEDLDEVLWMQEQMFTDLTFPIETDDQDDWE